MAEEFESAKCSGDCGSCGSDCEERSTITLTLDDDSELECNVICIFSVEEQDYIALLPVGSTTGEVYLYQYATVNGNPQLDNIESDDEYEKAGKGFEAWVEEKRKEFAQ